MFAAAATISIALALVLFFTAYATFTGREAVRRGVVEVGFPVSLLRFLGLAQFAGAVGLIAGLYWSPLAIAAAAGLVLYFLGAVGSHVRVGHPQRAGLSAVILLGCVAALVLVTLSA
ncbi:DoxX family protein [Streptomyces atratus]|uniref:DoxX family protein n=1 Tax=Streptomyces atratus TaxID=1893 RepID=UPI00224E5150|nr:DoxX family protein [Streptomyces atratus]MCX5339146.1 DoxX family protein [Streptomyces atratus]